MKLNFKDKSVLTDMTVHKINGGVFFFISQYTKTGKILSTLSVKLTDDEKDKLIELLKPNCK